MELWGRRRNVGSSTFTPAPACALWSTLPWPGPLLHDRARSLRHQPDGHDCLQKTFDKARARESMEGIRKLLPPLDDDASANMTLIFTIIEVQVK